MVKRKDNAVQYSNRYGSYKSCYQGRRIYYNRGGIDGPNTVLIVLFQDGNTLYPDESIKQDIPAALPATAPELPPPARLSRWQKIWHWEYTGLVIIILVTLGFHFAAVERPPTIVWDEKWYVGDARSIITGGGEVRPEHPPLAKLFVVTGEYLFNGFKVPEKDTGAALINRINTTATVIDVSDASAINVGDNIRIDREQLNVTGVFKDTNQISVERDVGGTGLYEHNRDARVYVFTDNPWGWRIFSILFGTLGIVVFYFICRKLKFTLRTSLIATFLFAFEDMTFLHSSFALLDVYMVTFMLVAVLLYLNENYMLSGIFVSLSAQCKLVGVLILIAMFLHFAIYRRDKWLPFVSSLLVAAVSYVFFIFIFDYFMTGSLENPITRIIAMLNGTSANVFSVPKLSIACYPWTWIYPQFVQLYYNSPNVPFIVYAYNPQAISFISSTIQIVIVPTVGYLIYKMAKGNQTAGLLVFWFLATYVIWIPLVLITNRVTFVFYFLPTTPAICIGIAMAMTDILGWLKNKRERAGRTTAGVKAWYGVLGFYLLLHLAIFVVLNPAIPPLIKTWLPPFSIGVDPTVALITLMNCV